MYKSPLEKAPNVTGYKAPAPPVSKSSSLYSSTGYRPSTSTAPVNSLYSAGPKTGAGQANRAPVSAATTWEGSLSGGYNPMYAAEVDLGSDVRPVVPGDPNWPDAAAGGNYETGEYATPPQLRTTTGDPFYNPGGNRRFGPYDPNLPGNAPATPGWPSHLPRPPSNVLPGTEAYSKWLKANGIRPESQLNAQIQQFLVRESMGYIDPTSVAPWAGSGGYSKYIDAYLRDRGLGVGQAPDSFNSDVYGGIMGDVRTAADMAGNSFNAEDATHFGALSNYANSLYDEDLGGLSGFDYKAIQESGIAAAEIARASAEKQLAQNLAGTGLSGQANSIYASSPMYNDYLNARVNAMTEPAMRAAELGIAGMDMASGNLNDLYGMEQSGDLAAANIYGQGLGVAANAGLGAGTADLDSWLAQQSLYADMPMDGYRAAMAAALARNQDIDSIYRTALESEQRKEDRRAGRQSGGAQIAQGVIGGVGSIAGLIAAL